MAESGDTVQSSKDTGNKNVCFSHSLFVCLFV